MARQRKDLTINKDLLKKASAVEPIIDATQKQDIVKPIHPVVNFPSLGPQGGNGKNFNFAPYYGKGFDDITNRVYYTAKSLLKNTDAFAESTLLSYLKSGFAYFADYLEIFHHSVGEDLTQVIFPTVDESALTRNTQTIVVQVNGKLRGKLDVAVDISKEDLLAQAKALPEVQQFLTGPTKKEIVVPNKLVNLVV